MTFDRLVNELIDTKKGMGRIFHPFNVNSFKKKTNHSVEVPVSTSVPATRALKKCISSMMQSGDGACFRSKKVTPHLEK